MLQRKSFRSISRLLLNNKNHQYSISNASCISNRFFQTCTRFNFDTMRSIFNNSITSPLLPVIQHRTPQCTIGRYQSWSRQTHNFNRFSTQSYKLNKKDSINSSGNNVPLTNINADSTDSKVNSDDEKFPAKLFLSFTCTVCNGSNSYMISKQAYTHGVVIVTCNTCSNRHLIADNLDWFPDSGGINIEEIMAEKGEKVSKFVGVDDNGVQEILPSENKR